MQHNKEINWEEIPDNIIIDTKTDNQIINLLKKGILVFGNIKTQWDTRTMGIFIHTKKNRGVNITYNEINALYNAYKKRGCDGVDDWIDLRRGKNI